MILNLPLAIGVFFASVIIIGAVAVLGQDYPSRPIRLVTSAVGGSNDFTARLLAQGLSTSLGQEVILDNRPTLFQGCWLPNAPRDGYNLLLGGEPIWQLPPLQKMTYDALRDFNPIVLVGNVFSVLVVHPSSGARS